MYVGLLITQWDRLFEASKRGATGKEGEGWNGDNGRLWLDCLPWVNYLAFDIVGDLAFGAPFGMLAAAKDAAIVPVQAQQEAVMRTYGGTQEADSKDTSAPQTHSIPAIRVLNGRGEFSMSMGVLPPWWRPIVKQFPWYRRGQADVKTLAGIAIWAVARRLAATSSTVSRNVPGKDSESESEGYGSEKGDEERVDLLAKLKAARDGDGNPLSKEELTAEALTLLIAGSDTTSKWVFFLMIFPLSL